MRFDSSNCSFICWSGLCRKLEESQFKLALRKTWKRLPCALVDLVQDAGEQGVTRDEHVEISCLEVANWALHAVDTTRPVDRPHNNVSLLWGRAAAVGSVSASFDS